MKTVLEIFTAALHEEGGIPEADAYRIASKLIPEGSRELVLAGCAEDVRARIIADYQKGKTVHELAKRYNRHRVTIWRILRRHEPDSEAVQCLEPSGVDVLLCCVKR